MVFEGDQVLLPEIAAWLPAHLMSESGRVWDKVVLSIGE